MHACRRGACGAPALSARRTRARRAHTARAPARRAAVNKIGDKGAKELAAALKANTTLSELNLWGACRVAPLPIHPTALPHAHAAGEGRAARQPQAHVRPRAAGNKIGAKGAKELAAELKSNETLTALHLHCARRGAPLPTHPAARACTRAGKGSAACQP